MYRYVLNNEDVLNAHLVDCNSITQLCTKRNAHSIMQIRIEKSTLTYNRFKLDRSRRSEIVSILFLIRSYIVYACFN